MASVVNYPILFFPCQSHLSNHHILTSSHQSNNSSIFLPDSSPSGPLFAKMANKNMQKQKEEEKKEEKQKEKKQKEEEKKEVE